MNTRNAWSVNAGLLVLLALMTASLACSAPLEPVRQTPPGSLETLPPAATSPANPAPSQAAVTPPASGGENPAPGGAEVNMVQITLVALEDAGKSGPAVGCGDSLVSINRPVPPTRDPIPAALTALFAIKQQNYGQSGFYNALWQSNLRVDSASVDANGVATVAISGQVQLGGECDTPRFKGQIEQTILAAPGVKAANVLLNGKPIDQALSLK